MVVRRDISEMGRMKFDDVNRVASPPRSKLEGLAGTERLATRLLLPPSASIGSKKKKKKREGKQQKCSGICAFIAFRAHVRKKKKRRGLSDTHAPRSSPNQAMPATPPFNRSHHPPRSSIKQVGRAYCGRSNDAGAAGASSGVAAASAAVADESWRSEAGIQANPSKLPPGSGHPSRHADQAACYGGGRPSGWRAAGGGGGSYSRCTREATAR